MKRFILPILLFVSVAAFGQTPGTTRFPSDLDNATTLLEAKNNAQSTLSSTINSSATSLTLASAASFPSSGVISCESEIIYYTGKSTNTLTGLMRGQEGTTAASHNSGRVVRMAITATYHNGLRSSIEAMQAKIGKGAALPQNGLPLVGNSDGSSSYQAVSSAALPSTISGKTISGGTLTGTFSGAPVINCANCTGITGATGGVSNTGSTTVTGDSDSNGSGVVSLTVGTTSVAEAQSDRFRLTKPLELPEDTISNIASMPTGTIARATNGNKGLYQVIGGRAVSLNQQVYNVALYDAGPHKTAAQNSTIIASILSAAPAGSIIYFPESLSFDTTITMQQMYTTIQGASRGVVLTYTGTGTGIDFNGKDYCGVENLTLYTTTGATGINLRLVTTPSTTTSHKPFIRKVKIDGFSAQNIRIFRTFYAVIEGCDIINSPIGIHSEAEGNGNHIIGNSIRDCAWGIKLGTNSANGPSNGNTITNNVIEGQTTHNGAVWVEGCHSNIISNNRFEYPTKIGVKLTHNTTTSETTAYTQLSHNVCPNTGKCYSIGESATSQKVLYTDISGGSGQDAEINAGAYQTKIDAAPSSYFALTDNGESTIQLTDPSNQRFYIKIGSTKVFDYTSSSALQLNSQLNVNTTALFSSQVSIANGNASNPALTLKLAPSQSNSALLIVDSANTAVGEIDAQGRWSANGKAIVLNSAGSLIQHASGGALAITANSFGGGTDIVMNPASGGALYFGNNNNANSLFYGDIQSVTAGKTLQIKTGSNACAGTATLSSGTVTVSTTCTGTLGTNRLVHLTPVGSSTGALRVSASVNDTSFTITSSDAASTDVVHWVILKIN